MSPSIGQFQPIIMRDQIYSSVGGDEPDLQLGIEEKFTSLSVVTDSQTDNQDMASRRLERRPSLRNTDSTFPF